MDRRLYEKCSNKDLHYFEVDYCFLIRSPPTCSPLTTNNNGPTTILYYTDWHTIYFVVTQMT